MKSSCIIISTVLAVVLLASCKKDQYGTLNGDTTLKGYAFLQDTIGHTSAQPLVKQKVYLNAGNDISAYLYETTTDSAGRFSISSLKENESYVLFTNYISGGIEYKGFVTFETGENTQVEKNLDIFASYVNGLSLLFTDNFGGRLPNLPFRLYTSRVAATYDSTIYAVVNLQSDINALYKKTNLTPVKYYVVSQKVIGPATLKIFDSVTAPITGIIRDTMVLK